VVDHHAKGRVVVSRAGNSDASNSTCHKFSAGIFACGEFFFFWKKFSLMEKVQFGSKIYGNPFCGF